MKNKSNTKKIDVYVPADHARTVSFAESKFITEFVPGNSGITNPIVVPNRKKYMPSSGDPSTNPNKLVKK